MDWTIPIIILQLIFLQVILSIDNAAVLGSLVAHLPDDRPVQWPKALWKIGDWLHPVLGNQRTAALRVGLIGAYLAQGAMLFLATQISHTPWIKIVGAIYLIRLAFDNLGEAEAGEADAHGRGLRQIRGIQRGLLHRTQTEGTHQAPVRFRCCHGDQFLAQIRSDE